MQLQRLKEGENFSKKSVISDERIQKELQENVAAKRALIVQQMLLLSEMIDPSLKEALKPGAADDSADNDNNDADVSERLILRDNVEEQDDE